MDQLKFTIFVPAALALREGSTQHGRAVYAPTVAELAELSEPERIALGRYGAWTTSADALRLDTAAVSWPEVCAALRRDLAEEAAAKARQDAAEAAARAEAEPAILAALALDDDAWVSGSSVDTSAYLVAKAPLDTLAGAAYAVAVADSRVVARRRSVTADAIPRVRVEFERAKAERQAEREAAAAARKADLEAARTDLRTWAAEHGPEHVRRAVRDGYEGVESAVVDLVAESLAASVAGYVLRDGSPAWDAHAWEDRRAPDATAFAVLDRVTALVAKLAKPSSLTVRVEKIRRVTVTTRDGYDETKRERFSAVLVWLEHPLVKDRVVIVSAE